MEYITIILAVLTFIGSAMIGLVVWAFKINSGIDKKVASGINTYHLAQEKLRVERDKRFTQNYNQQEKEIAELFDEKEKFIVKDMQFDDKFVNIGLKLNTLETLIKPKIGG